MTSYTDVFGGQNVNPAQLNYRAVSLTASVTLVWPRDAQDGTNNVAKKMDVTPTAGGYVITMPSALLASTGEDVLFVNPSAFSFSVVDAAGGALATVAAGQAWLLYLKTNAIAAGTWRAIQYGTGTSSADAATLAGYGLLAITTTLNQSHPVVTKSANYTLLAADRAKVVVSTGGAITFAFTAAATLADNWFVLVRNDGTGNLTLDPSGGELIDGSATITLAPTESCFVTCDGSAFRSVGRGRVSTVTVSAATISGAGGAGNQSLSSTEIGAQVQTYTGALTGARNYEYGSSAGYWFIKNSLTLSGNTATWRVNSGDTGVTSTSIPSGASAIIVSDGTNMRLAVVVTGGIPSVISGNTTAVAFGRYAVDTTGGAVTLTLPASPAVGDWVEFADARANFAAANLTIARNASPIMGAAADLTVSTKNANGHLEYIDATQGWIRWE